ncbi:MAG: MBOAT family O-acyltransferase [Ruthenibacterium lactatiformans]
MSAVRSSQSVAEFWRNWHISLSSFFEITCISRWEAAAGLARTCVNTMVVFLCSGLWHGAAWTFVAWGLLHGLYLVCGRLTLPLRKRLYTALRVPYGCLPRGFGAQRGRLRWWRFR